MKRGDSLTPAPIIVPAVILSTSRQSHLSCSRAPRNAAIWDAVAAPASAAPLRPHSFPAPDSIALRPAPTIRSESCRTEITHAYEPLSRGAPSLCRFPDGARPLDRPARPHLRGVSGRRPSLGPRHAVRHLPCRQYRRRFHGWRDRPRLSLWHVRLVVGGIGWHRLTAAFAVSRAAHLADRQPTSAFDPRRLPGTPLQQIREGRGRGSILVRRAGHSGRATDRHFLDPQRRHRPA